MVLLQKIYIYFLINLILVSSTGITLHFHKCWSIGYQFAFVFEKFICEHQEKGTQSNNHSNCEVNEYQSDLCNLHSLYSNNYRAQNSLDKEYLFNQKKIKSLCCSEYSQFFNIEDAYQQKCNYNNLTKPLEINSDYQRILEYLKYNFEKTKEILINSHLDFRDYIISYIQTTKNIIISEPSDFDIC